MTTTLAFCTLLLGGWISPEIDDSTPPLREDMTQPETVQANEMRLQGKTISLLPAPSLANGLGGPSGSAYPGTGTGTGSQSQWRRPAGAMPGMPTSPGTGAPTGPNGNYGGPGAYGYGAAGMPAAPTRSSEDAYGAGASRRSGWGAAQSPMDSGSPDANRSNMQPAAPSATSDINQGAGNYYANLRPAGAPGALGNPKAFDNASLAPRASPYLNLYTSRTANGTIDPYTSAVVPALDQIQNQQKVSAQIGGLQKTLRRPAGTGGMEVPTGQGLANPGQFINYPQYPPGSPANMMPMPPTTP